VRIGKCCGALRQAFSFILISFLFFPIDSQPKDSTSYGWDGLLAEFKKGNYSLVAKESKKEIDGSDCREVNLRFLLIYISSSSNLEEMDSTMESCYNNNKNLDRNFFNSNFLLLERAVVSGNPTIGEKWGYRFRKDGSISSRYAEGLYLYATLFYQTKKFKDSLFILNLVPLQEPNSILNVKIQRLKSAVKSQLETASDP